MWCRAQVRPDAESPGVVAQLRSQYTEAAPAAHPKGIPRIPFAPPMPSTPKVPPAHGLTPPAAAPDAIAEGEEVFSPSAEYESSEEE